VLTPRRYRWRYRILAFHDNIEPVTVYAVVDDALSPDFPLGVELETFIRRENGGPRVRRCSDGRDRKMPPRSP
jgi:hypothetical protein